jgi:thiol-disulfide isomerase/thioredoxin
MNRGISTNASRISRVAPLGRAVVAVFALFALGSLLTSLAGCRPAAASDSEELAAAPTENQADKHADGKPADPTATSPAANKPSEKPSEKPSAKPSAASEQAPPAKAGPAKGNPTGADTKDKPVAKPAPGDAAPDEAPEDAAADDPDFPFPNRVKSPSLDGGVGWINTAGPIDIKDLKGKFVVLDFWTYCCINCMHVLPELKKLEKAYPNNVVVIGVHSAKFETEKDTKNITEAVQRYEIEHPVINDAKSVLFRKFAAGGWPAIRIVDPEGYFIGGEGGEVPFEAFDAFFKKAIPIYKKRGSLDETPLHFDLAAKKAAPTPLRFPGKLAADEAGNRLFISDSNHNRIVVTDLAGKLLATIGSGAIGKADGDYRTATFDHPQGVAIHGDTLYVADTENHLLRKVDLKAQRVTTIAGTGLQSKNPWPGADKIDRSLLEEPKYPDRWVGKPRETALSSPWDVLVFRDALYIAMAGPHQIWKMPLDESEIGPYAGNGREDIVDGPLLPKTPFARGFASFAQPSGLTTDGQRLIVADSEGSSIRSVPFDDKQEVETIVGTANLDEGRLFEFGDEDGVGDAVKLQHALGVVAVDGRIYIADTYNSKIKVLDPAKKSVATIAGGGAKNDAGKAEPDKEEPEKAEPGKAAPAKPEPETTAAASEFDEPAGIAYAAGKLYIADTNAHRIRTLDLKNHNRIATLDIAGLTPPATSKTPDKPSFAGATAVALDKATLRPTKRADGKPAIKLAVKLALPLDWKVNALAPTSYYIEAAGERGAVDRAAIGKVTTIDKPAAEFEITLPLAAGDAKTDTLKILVTHYYCQEGERGLCKVASIAFDVPIAIAADGKETAELRYDLK